MVTQTELNNGGQNIVVNSYRLGWNKYAKFKLILIYVTIFSTNQKLRTAVVRVLSPGCLFLVFFKVAFITKETSVA